jgi:hypothetical protein
VNKSADRVHRNAHRVNKSVHSVNNYVYGIDKFFVGLKANVLLIRSIKLCLYCKPHLLTLNSNAMLVYDIEPLVRLYGKSEPIRFLVGQGMSRTVASGIVYNDRTRWNPWHMARLCEIFKCTVNDILRYTGDNPNHPMLSVERPRIVALADVFKDKSFSEMMRLHEKLRKGEL